MVVDLRIKAVVPDISTADLEHAVAFAVSAMRQTRDAYHEPVALQEVALSTGQLLSFTVRTLFTHNTMKYHLAYEPYGNSENNSIESQSLQGAR